MPEYFGSVLPAPTIPSARPPTDASRDLCTVTIAIQRPYRTQRKVKGALLTYNVEKHLMKLSVLWLFLASSCTSTITTEEDWSKCNLACWANDDLGGSFTKETCHSYFKGLGCTCHNGKTLWLGKE